MNDKCWLYDCCNHIDCDKVCVRKYKLTYLYNEANLSSAQRNHMKFVVDDDGSDLENFKYLSKIENNIVKFVDNGYNLYIHSTICGNGKTSWALRMIQSYLNKIWVHSSMSCRALFIEVPKLLIALKDNISQHSEYVEHIKNNISKADLVVWDEIGSKGLTQFEHENMLSMVNERINIGKSNIYTSNLRNDELHSTIGDRLYSRIVNYSEEVELKGNDKRGLKL